MPGLLTTCMEEHSHTSPQYSRSVSRITSHNLSYKSRILHSECVDQNTHLDRCRAASLSCSDLVVRVARLLFLLPLSTVTTRPLRDECITPLGPYGLRLQSHNAACQLYHN